MEKFKKIDREYKLSDSSLNSYSYRLLTSGYLMDEYAKNPIGYFMHGTDEFPRESGALLKWEDLRIDGDIVWAKPVINLNHPRGAKTVDEIESGFLNAASMGNIVAIEISSDPDDYLPGQTGPTVKKWYNRECSLVDIPGNYNAVANLVDENDNPINLADFNTQKFTMEKIFLTPAQILMLPNLKADATQAQVDTALQDLVAKAAKVDALTADIATANTAKDTAETALKNLQAATTKKEVEAIADGALNDKKITAETCAKLKVQFDGKPDELKDLVATLQPFQGVVASIDNNSKALQDLIAKDYDTLDKENKLEALKAGAPEEFFAKFETKFGKRHSSDTRK